MRVLAIAVGLCDLLWRTVRGIGLLRFGIVISLFFGSLYAFRHRPGIANALHELIELLIVGLSLTVLGHLAAFVIEEARSNPELLKRYCAIRSIKEALALNREVWPQIWRHYPW
jgi:hypothetical protein